MEIRIIAPTIPKDKDSLNNNDWIKLVENSDKELDVALGIFSNAADSYMDEMDKKLMRCQWTFWSLTLALNIHVIV